jgi:hypothetical protein
MMGEKRLKQKSEVQVMEEGRQLLDVVVWNVIH